jgi:hypothetical protein
LIECDSHECRAEKEIVSLSFEEQLEYLAQALSEENKRLQVLLQDHEKEEREKKQKEKRDKNVKTNNKES